MGGAPKLGSQSCPIELENDEEDDNPLWPSGDKKKKSLLQPSLLGTPTSTVKYSTDIMIMDTSPSPSATGLQIIPFNNPSEPSSLQNSANPKVPAPVSPSIEDLANPRIAESGNHSPGEPGDAGYAENLWALDDATHGGTLSGASRGFKRLTKGHRSSVGHVKMEHVDGVNVGSSQKTELEREMELFEAAEREEEARLLTSLRQNQSGDCSPSSKSPNSMESIQADWKWEQLRPRQGRKAGISSEALRKEEDVCFSCFDGGKLILCDKRSCPKAYHMECTGRESEFFRAKGQWFCGWHVCADCMRSAAMHCYTCPTAYCSGCIKDTDFLCLRKGHGLCEQCYRIVYMIEHNLSIDSEGVEVNFDDEETYECLFRDYWKDIKEKLSLSWAEINKAHETKDAVEPLGMGFRTRKLPDNEGSTDLGCRVKRQSQRLKRKRITKSAAIDDGSASDFDDDDDDDDEEEEQQQEEEEEEEEEDEEEFLGKPRRGQQKGRQFIGWASKELLDFLNSLKEDSKKPLTLLSLNKLVLSYVKSNKLSSARRRGQIMCDQRLQSLFGKKHIGKFEMMKLLNKHIASKKSTMAKRLDFMSGSEDNAEFDNADDKVHKQRKSRKKLEDTKHLKLDPTQYAAIDVNNISLIYLKRSLLEDLQKDLDFDSKVKGAFVRIRVPSMVNRSDTCYRLVQIVGVKQRPINARNNVKTADVVLEILNLQKREEITVDLISGQDFTEEECQRLRQSVKCGLLKPMTAGELREKARILREAKVKDHFDTELLRLSHLRDRASEKGRRKDLRECVERLQLLSSPSERERQLRAPIEVNVDPHMDPDYESDNAGKSIKEFQGTQNPWETGFGKQQQEINGASVKNPKSQGNGCWAEAAHDAGTLETKLQAGWVKPKNSGRDNLGQFSVNPFNDKSTSAGNFTLGAAEDAGHDAGGLNHVRSLSQKDSAVHNATGLNHQGSFTQRKDGQGGVSRKDGGWGEDLKGGQQDFGWGQSGCGLKRSGGWGEGGDGLTNDGWDGGNTKDDKWAGNAGDDTKDDGWGVVGIIKKDDGWNCCTDDLAEVAGNRKKETCDTNVGGGMKHHGWGSDVGTSEKDGWGDGRGDGQKHDRGGQKHNGWADGGDGQQYDGWGDCGGGQTHDGWGASVHSHNDDGWGHGGGGVANDDDGWGGIAGGESEGGWGNPAVKNEKCVTWGAEASGNETNTGDGWGKTGGTSTDHGWGARSSATERSSSWNNRGSYRDAAFDRRDGKPRAETRHPYKDTGGFSQVLGRASAHHTSASVPEVAARTGSNPVGSVIKNEKEKVWYYQDPTKTIQGPFSMEQLRKWEKTKLFPLNLRVWRATESQDASILLTDALLGRFHNDLPPGFDQYPGRGFSAFREDVRNGYSSRPGSSSQDKGRRPKYNEWASERRHASHNDGGSGTRPDRPRGSRDLCKLSPHDGDWEESRGGPHGNPPHHHYSSRHYNDGKFSTKKKSFPCRYFAQGMCKKGDECDFMH